MRYGETSKGDMEMTLVRPTWKRTISMKMWTKGTDYSMVIITAPAKEKGQVFQYIPKKSIINHDTTLKLKSIADPGKILVLKKKPFELFYNFINQNVTLAS